MLHDFRYAFRVLLTQPGFAVTAVITLALGLGLNVTVFSILNVLLLKPLPVKDADRLVWITGAAIPPDPPRERLTLPDITDFDGGAGAVDGVAGFAPATVALRGGQQTLRAAGQIVTANYFGVVGADLPLGRGFSPEHDRSDHERVAVISDRLWNRLFDRRPDAAGSIVEINGMAFTVAGVAPPGFSGPDLFSPADLWIPIGMASRVTDVRDPHSRNQWWLQAVGRLESTTTLEQARMALNGIARGIAEAHPDSHARFAVMLHPVRGVNPGDRDKLGGLALLPAVPITVLLIACANVAGLLLARGAARTHELAIRKAIGATRWQIVRQMLAENVTIAILAGAASLLLSLWAPDLLLRFADAPLSADFTPDVRVLVFTLIISLLTAVVFGTLPALRASKLAVVSLRTASGGATRRLESTRLQRLLVIGQLALSLVLLMAAGSFVQSVARAARAQVGFDPSGIVTLTTDLQMQRYDLERAAAFYRNAMERAAAIPGIRSVTYASYVPLGGRVEFTPYYTPADRRSPGERAPTTAVNRVGPQFFETLAIPVLRGRGIQERDLSSTPHVAVINETLASRLVGGGNAIGEQLTLGRPDAQPVEVIGIAADVLVDEFGESPRPFAYLPHARNPGEVSLIASSTLPPATALKELERAVHSIDPTVAVFQAMPMSQHLAARMDGERGLSRMLAVAGGLALALAAFGLYAILAFAVARRTREIGVRMALGARPRDVLGLFVREGATLALVGLGAGLVPGTALTVVLAGTVFGVRPGDPVLIAAAGLVLVAVALCASYMPARRALRVNPVDALKAE